MTIIKKQESLQADVRQNLSLNATSAASARPAPGELKVKEQDFGFKYIPHSWLQDTELDAGARLWLDALHAGARKGYMRARAHCLYGRAV